MRLTGLKKKKTGGDPQKDITPISLRTVAGYFIFGVLWILLSDNILLFFVPSASPTYVLIQSLKGWLFVSLSALLIYVILRNDLKALGEREHLITYQAGLLEQVSDALISTDAEFKVLSWNPAAERIYGWSEKEVLGKSLADFVQTDFGEIRRDRVMEEVMGAGTWSGEVTQLRKDGRRISIWSSVSAVHDEKGGLTGFIGVNRDVTSRALAEGILRESQELYRELFENNPQPMWVYDLETLAFRMVNDAAVRHYGYTREEFLSMTIKDIRPQEEVPALLENIAQSSQPLEKSTGWHHRKKDGSLIDVEISSHVTQFNGRAARLVLANDVTERVKVEESLRESERRNRALFDQYHDAVFILDLEGNHLDVNQRAADMLGYTRDEMIGLSVRQLSAEPEQSQNVVRRLLDGERFPVYERLFRRKDGSTLPVEINVELIRNPDGSPKHIQSVVRDISERKRADAALKVSEENYRSLAETSDSAIAVLNRDGELLYANPTSIGIWNDPELIGKTVHDLFPPETAAKYLAVIRRVIDKRVVDLNELNIQINDREMWFRVSLSPLKNPDGAVNALLLNALDFTKRKQTEEALRRSEEKFSRAFMTNPAAVILSRLADGVQLEVNDSYCRLVGYSREELLGRPTSEFDIFIHPEQRRQLVEQLKTEGTIRNNEVTLKNKAGELRTVLASVEGLEFNNEECVLTTLVDITDRKQAQADLLAAHQSTQATIDGMRAQLCVLDGTGKILSVNRAWREFADANPPAPPNYSVGDNYLETCENASGPNSREAWAFAAALRAVLTGASEGFDMEYSCHVPGGEQRWFTAHVARFLSGGRMRVVITHENITGRVLAEMQTQQMKRLYATLSQVNQTIVRAKEPGELYRSICDLVVKYGEFSLAWVGLLNENTGEIQPVAANGMDLGNWKLPTININSEKFKDHLTTQAIRTGMTATSMDVQTDPRLDAMRDFISELPYHSTAVVPFKRGGKVIGTLAIVSPQAGFFKAEEELALLEEMGLDITFALDTMENDRIKRQWADAFEHSAHGMVIGDAKTNRILACNPAFAREQGMPIQELIDMPIIDMYLPEDHERINQLIAQSDREGAAQFEGVKIRKDGNTYPFQLDVVSVRDEHGDLLYRVASQQDITGRKRAEAEQLRLIQVLDLSLNEIYIFDDRTLKFTYVNQGAVGNLGYSMEELRQMTPVDLKPEFTQETFKSMIRPLLDLEKDALVFETVHRRKNGSLYPVEVHLQLVTTYAGRNFAAIIHDITERVAAREELAARHRDMVGIARELQESNNMLELIIESAPIRVFWKDTGSRYLGCNLLFARDAGYNHPGEIVGKFDEEFVWKENAETFQQEEREIIETGIPILNQIKMKALPGGGIMWINVSVAPLRDSDGRIIGTMGIYEDITERMTAEDALRKSEARFRALFDDVPIAIWEQDFSEVRKHLNALKAGGVTHFRAYFKEHPEELLHCLSMIRILDLNQAAVRMYEAKDKQELIEATTVETSPGELENGVEELIAIAEGRASHFWEGRDDTMTGRPIEIRMVWSVVPGHEQDYARVIVTTQDITERKRAEQALLHSKALLTEAQQISHLGNWEWDIQKESLFWSDEVYRIFGVSPVDFFPTAQSFEDMIHPEDREEFLRQRALMLEEKHSDSIEHRILLPTGEVRHVQERTQLVEDEQGRVVRIVGTVQDITGRKQAETALRESEERYRNTLDTMQEGCQIVDFDWRYVYVNEMVARQGRMTREALMGRAMTEIYPGIETTEMFAVLRDCMENRVTRQMENEFRFPDGSIGWFDLSIQPVPEGIFILSTDISERKQAETALKESEERYRLLFDHAPFGVLLADSRGKIIEVNPTALSVLGSPSVEATRAINMLTFPPLVEAGIAADFEKCIRLGALVDGEYTYTTKWGKSIIAVVRFVPIMGGDASTSLVQIILEDATESKRAQESLLLQSAALEAVANSIVITNRDGLIQWANPAFTALTGFSLAEAVGKNPRELVRSGKQDRGFYRDMWDTILAGRVWRGELVNRRKDGSYYNEEMTLTPLRDAQGEIAYFIAIKQDITERKRAAEALDQRLAELELLYQSGLALGGELEPQQVAGKLIEALETKMDWHHIAIRKYDPGSDRLELLAFKQPGFENETQNQSVEERFNKAVTNSSQGLSGWAVRNGQTVRSGDVRADPRYTETYPGIGSGLYAPMILSGRVVGVISVESKELNAFDESVERLLKTIANQAAVAFENARLFQDLQHELNERIQAEKALRESEERLRLTLQTTSDGFWIVDPEGKFLEVNNAYCEMSGYSRGELLHMSIPDVEVIKSMDDMRGHINRVEHERHERFETRHRRKDGSEFDVEFTVNLLDEQTGLLICFCRDITERKRAEREILQRTQDLTLISALNDAANRGESVETIINLFTQEAYSMFDCRDVAVYLITPDGKYLEMHKDSVSSETKKQIEDFIGISIPKIRLPIREGSHTQYLLSHAEGILMNEPEEIQKWILEFTETTFLPNVLRAPIRAIIPRTFELLGIHSTITIPLVSSEQTIGLMDFSSANRFTGEDLQRLLPLTRQITAILLRKRAESSLQVQLKRITALNDIDRAIGSSLDMRLSLEVLLKEVVSQLSVDAADVLLLNPVDQALEYMVGRGFRTSGIRQTRLMLGQGSAGKAGLEQKVVHIPNLQTSGGEFVRSNLLKGEEFVEYFGVPLLAKGALKGILEIFNRTPLTPDPDWLSYLETLGGQAAIAVDSAELFAAIQHSNQELMAAYDATIAGWSHAMDLRDKETEGHTLRVTELARQLAARMGVSQQEQIQIRRGALLHDIGKLGVPDHILLKPGKLTEEEWEIMRKHPTYAYEMLLPIAYLEPALDIPYCHHEKWDGSGYPRGLKGEQIPLAARIFAVVDVWDALRSDRPYRAGWSAQRIREHIRSESGKHFDPRVVETFIAMLDESPDMK